MAYWTPKNVNPLQNEAPRVAVGHGRAVHGGRMEQPSEHARTYTGQDMDMGTLPHPTAAHCGAATASTNHTVAAAAAAAAAAATAATAAIAAIAARRCRCCQPVVVGRGGSCRPNTVHSAKQRVLLDATRIEGPIFFAPLGPPQADR